MNNSKSQSRSKKPKRKLAYQVGPRQGGGVLLTAEELAKQLGEREHTIWTLYRNGIIPGYDLGWRIRRFKLAECLEALEKRKVK
jgi:hypothetical protein